MFNLIRAVEAATGLSITADCYKRPKESLDPRLAPYFAWKGQIGCTRHEDFSEATFGPDLKDRVLDFFRKLLPLYEFFNRFAV